MSTETSVPKCNTCERSARRRIRWAIDEAEARGYGPAASRVLCALAAISAHAGESRVAQVGIDRLASASSISETSCRKALLRLRKDRLILVCRSFEGGPQRANIYALQYPADYLHPDERQTERGSHAP